MARESSSQRVRLREPTDDFLLKALGPFVLLILASGPIGGWGEVPFAITVLGWTCVFALAAMLVRSWKVGVYVSVDGIEITGYASRRRVPWKEISEFARSCPEARFWKWAPVAVLNDGSRIPMNAIQAPQPWTRPANQFDTLAVAKLEELLARARARGGTVDTGDLDFDRRFGY